MRRMILISSIATCYFQVFIPAGLQKCRPSPPRCCANTAGQENPSASRANATSCREKRPSLSRLGAQRAGSGRGAGCEAGAEPACQHQPCPCPVLPLPRGFLVYLKRLTRVQESGTWGKVPALCPEGSIQCAGINAAGCFPPVIVDWQIGK